MGHHVHGNQAFGNARVHYGDVNNYGAPPAAHTDPGMRDREKQAKTLC